MLEKFCPDEIVPRLEDVDQQALRARGVKGLLIDVDNTLTEWRDDEIPPRRLEWMHRAKADFAICLLSNSVTLTRLKRLARRLGLPHVGRWGWGRKPFRGGYRVALKEIGTSPENTAMIGDQLLTDVFGGNRLGMHTIMVQPLSDSEFFITRINRWIEAWLMARFTHYGILPQVSRHISPESEADNAPG